MNPSSIFISIATAVAVAGAIGAAYAQSTTQGPASPEAGSVNRPQPVLPEAAPAARPPSVAQTPPSSTLRDAMKAAAPSPQNQPSAGAINDGAGNASIDRTPLPMAIERAPQADRN